MGYPDDEARGALRISLGRTTTADEVDRAAATIPAVLDAHRAGEVALAEVPLAEAPLAG
jgi:cysteine desulfurase